MMMRTPLAWKNLSCDLRRLLLGSLGVGFAVVLMFMQRGFQNALLDSPVQMFQLVEGDLIASSKAWYTLMSEKKFSDDLLLRAASQPQVEWVEPIFFEKAVTRLRVKGKKARTIRVLAISNDPKIFTDPKVAAKVQKLRRPMSAIVDYLSKPTYGFNFDDPMALSRQDVELMDRKITVVDSIKVGIDFANDGNMLVSTNTFARCFPFRGNGDPLSKVDFALIKLISPDRKGVRAQEIADRLTALAPEQWKVYTREQFLQKEINFWENETPIGLIFYVGVIMGFAVGIIVCYQILYNNIHDSMSELATLKAMGYRDSYFFWFVIQQAFFLSVLGFLPATLLCYGLFSLLESVAGLPMNLSPPRIAWIYLPTLAMCVISGILAVRKLWQADPASLF